MKNLIDVTVAMPLWNMEPISWLQLESLCRQQTGYSWELIVCEEQLENFTGKQNIISYRDRLRQAGCKSIKYIPLTVREPLSKKWAKIAKQAQGKTFILAAGDNYSPPNRVELTHQIMTAGDYDWFDVQKGIFLNINDFSMATYDHIAYNDWNFHSTALFMGVRTSILKPIVELLDRSDCVYTWPMSGVDGWMRKWVKPRKHKTYRHQHELLGIHTDGANQISGVITEISRVSRYSNKTYKKPFRKPTQKLEDILPDNIHERLKDVMFNRILYKIDE